MTQSLELKNISFSYTNIPLLKNISLTIQKNSWLSILGPNGEGKTTLLKLMGKLLHPQEGELWLYEKPFHSISLKEFAQTLAYVPQGVEPVYAISVFDFVLMGRTPFLTGLSFESHEDRECAEMNLKSTDTFHLKNRFFHTLSSGEKQRVLIARALTQTPRIILLDEPTAHLDLKYQLEILSLLERLQKERELTLVMVLHDLGLARHFSQEIVFIKNYSIFAQGKAEELLTEEIIYRVFNVRLKVQAVYEK